MQKSQPTLCNYYTFLNFPYGQIINIYYNLYMSNFKQIEDLFELDLQKIRFVDDIPWLFAEPEKAFLEWTTKVRFYFSQEENHLSHLQSLLNQNLLEGHGKGRIQQFIKDKHTHLKQMKKILNPFLQEDKQQLSFDNQNILSYQTNIFRDWVWGKEENKTYCDYIKNSLKGDEKNILVLGAGSCGLSYELATQTKANIIAIDINPYLFICAKKLMNKKHLKLFEFIENPSKIENISIKRDLSPVDSIQNHHQVFCDFYQLPFKAGSFDMIVGCWFYDIIDTSLDTSLLHINNYLSAEGQSIFIGPSSFHKKNIEQSITTEEIVENFKNNYSEVEFKTQNITYLNNPHSTYKRMEEILFLKGDKKSNQKVFEAQSTFEEIIQLTPELMAFKQKTEIFHRILKHISQPITLKALARMIQEEFGFSQEEANYYAENFIKKLNFEIS